MACNRTHWVMPTTITIPKTVIKVTINGSGAAYLSCPQWAPAATWKKLPQGIFYLTSFSVWYESINHECWVHEICTKLPAFCRQYFQTHFDREKYYILIRISLNHIPSGPTDNAVSGNGLQSGIEDTGLCLIAWMQTKQISLYNGPCLSYRFVCLHYSCWYPHCSVVIISNVIIMQILMLLSQIIIAAQQREQICCAYTGVNRLHYYKN